MATSAGDLPPHLAHKWRQELLEQMRGEEILDADELSLFEWYVHENGKVIERMLAEERAFVNEQIDAGQTDASADNAGWLVAEYHIKRIRYADVIYMASLLEMYLAKACKKVTTILGEHNVVFRSDELAGDKWTKRKKFLERYGRFEFPPDNWSELQVLVRVRNILVHENGSSESITASDKNQLVARGITVDRHELVIEDAFITHCFLAFRLLVAFVGQQVDQMAARALHPESL
ncbi:MAG: hypothetical protein WDM91_08250 [Rhizomicrobium sp.]